MSWKTLASAAGMMMVLGACAGQKAQVKSGAEQAGKPGPVATADIAGRGGSSLIGNATFQQRGDKVLVQVQVQSAPPGEHGVHIHENGDCSAPDGKSAGGHFNPGKVDHGAPGSAVHHPGDFGNITVKEDGTGTLELEVPTLTVTEGPMSVQGKAIIIHEKPDDFGQPTGNAGGRIGCGVIAVAPQGPSQQAPAGQQAPQ